MLLIDLLPAFAGDAADASLLSSDKIELHFEYCLAKDLREVSAVELIVWVAVVPVALVWEPAETVAVEVAVAAGEVTFVVVASLSAVGVAAAVVSAAVPLPPSYTVSSGATHPTSGSNLPIGDPSPGKVVVVAGTVEELVAAIVVAADTGLVEHFEHSFAGVY